MEKTVPQRGGRISKPLRDLIDIIHFTEIVSAKIHDMLDEAEIYRTVKEEFAKSKRYNASIFLLTDDASKLRIAEISLSPGKLKAAEKVGVKAAGLQVKEYKRIIDLSKSTIFSQVVREGKTVQTKVIDIINEFVPQPVARLIAKIIGYEKRATILTPLYRHGKIIGALGISSTTLAEHFIPSVRNLAQHISTALKTADLYAERKRAEENLKKYEIMVESAHDAIFFKDLESRYIIANNKTLEAFGLPRERIIGRNDYELMPNQEEAKKNVEDDQLVFKTEKSVEIIKHMTALDGKTYWFHAIKVPQFDEKGNVIGLVGIARDITERKRVEEALRESKEKLQSIFSTMADGITLVGLDGKILECNDSILRLHGISKDEYIGKNVYDLIVPEDRQRAIQESSEVLEKGFLRSEVKALRKRGENFDAEINVSLLKDASGKPMAFLGVTRDITERKRMEEDLRRYSERLEEMVEERTGELRESQAYLESSLASTPDGVILLNEQGRFRYVNATFLGWLGREEKDFVGKNVLEISPPIMSPETTKIIAERVKKRLKTGETIIGAEVEIIDKEGKPMPISYSAAGIKDEKGDIIGEVVFIKDITERKRLEEQLLRAERLAAIGEMAAMVGHDLRNPLQATINILYLVNERLKSMSSAEEFHQQKQWLEELYGTIEEQVNYMNKIVSDLQDYARPVKLQLAETSLHHLINNTLSTLKAPKSVEVSIAIAEDFKLTADPTLMKRVFTNLITNALQAMPDGGQLTIRASKTAETALISIEDTGIGISEENIPKLFQPLFTTKAKGAGIGLPVCRRLVEAHNGSITVESKVGRGSTFTTKIPLKGR